MIPNTDPGKCVISSSSDPLPEARTLFMVDGWRNQLCRCSDCTKKYEDDKVSYLLNPEDTVHHYEEKSKEIKGESSQDGIKGVLAIPKYYLPGSQYEDGMKALSEMERTKQVEAIQQYNSMKSNLMEYLQKFKDSGKVVRQEDIQEFFEQMKSRKKQRVEIPKFCK